MNDKLWSFWNGPDEKDRRGTYAKFFLPEYEAAGGDLQRRISAVEAPFRSETGITLPEGYALGWAPRSDTNEASEHHVGNAGDRRDTEDGAFAWWCLRNPRVLEVHGLYMEHPCSTVLTAWARARGLDVAPAPWCHLQSVAPKDHVRVFFASSKGVEDWDAFLASGGVAGMGYKDWLALMGGSAEPPPSVDSQSSSVRKLRKVSGY